ncbi:response regulator [Mucilaginibacter jinjuensis]|uniref:Response regulator n=1 Tax=Mucilaginibacter jinjuensis TaxID=1176721 RepID=A0ABY7TFB8_9SPHI|nr:response regulator [Mucilaginibacter jinjuensis]WCT14893.1 response regulator [Mucilaginibacter jinjuensis]
MKKRILILDDDKDILDILEEILVYEDFDVAIVESTDDLCNLVRAYQPSLILLDFSLNGMDGGEWCTKLKIDPEFAHIPVIIFSAYSNKGISKGTYGCDDFIDKPFDLEDLLARINLLTVVRYSLCFKETQQAQMPLGRIAKTIAVRQGNEF